MKESVFVWLRRDLRLTDNHALYQALSRHKDVIPIFVFDHAILNALDNKADARVSFVHEQLTRLDQQLARIGKGLFVMAGNVLDVFGQLTNSHNIKAVYANRDDEPSAIKRDRLVADLLESKGASLHLFKDKSVFEREEVVKSNGDPYSVFTPYRRKWIDLFHSQPLPHYPSEDVLDALSARDKSNGVPDLEEIGFRPTNIDIPPAIVDQSLLEQYEKQRDFPALEGTSRLGIHLRFGSLSPRQLIAQNKSDTWLSQLIWREFFQQTLFHHPHVVDTEFRANLRQLPWLRDHESFHLWCNGRTGFPLVDAGLRELVSTGHMHNRVRMLAASFLVKSLLIDWRWGERFFAKHLLDFELASNVGNWQWVAGTGCDAAPYFRIFNPVRQAKRFDADQNYIQRWLPEWGTADYPKPMIDLAFARQRALAVYRQAQSLHLAMIESTRSQP